MKELLEPCSDIPSTLINSFALSQRLHLKTPTGPQGAAEIGEVEQVLPEAERSVSPD